MQSKYIHKLLVWAVGRASETTDVSVSPIHLTKTMNNKQKNICGICGHNNPEDNFICEHHECGAPLDLTIEYLPDGLPIIK